MAPSTKKRIARRRRVLCHKRHDFPAIYSLPSVRLGACVPSGGRPGRRVPRRPARLGEARAFSAPSRPPRRRAATLTTDSSLSLETGVS